MAYEDYIPNTYKQLDEEDETTKRGVLDRVLSPLMNTSVTSALYNVTDDNPDTTFLGGIGAGLARQFNPLKDDVSDTHEFGDVLDNVLGKTTDKDSLTTKATRLAAGFVGDTLLDPMSYVGGVASGVGKILKGTSSAVDSVRAAENIAKTGANVKKAVDIKDCVDVVSKKYSKTNLDESSVIVESEAKNLLDSWNKKIERRKTDEEIKNSKGVVIGLCNLPFSSKFNTKLKESAIFEKELIKGEDLAKFGDRTVAPYYNKLSETLRRTKLGQFFSDNNKIFAESFTDLNRALNNFSIAEEKKSIGGDAVNMANESYKQGSIFDSLSKPEQDALITMYRNDDVEGFKEFIKIRKTILEKIRKNGSENAFPEEVLKGFEQDEKLINKKMEMFDSLIEEVKEYDDSAYNIGEGVLQKGDYDNARNITNTNKPTRYKTIKSRSEDQEDFIDELFMRLGTGLERIPNEISSKDVKQMEEEAVDKVADIKRWLYENNGTDKDSSAFIYDYLKSKPDFMSNAVSKETGFTLAQTEDIISSRINDYNNKIKEAEEKLKTLPKNSPEAKACRKQIEALNLFKETWDGMHMELDLPKTIDASELDEVNAEIDQLEKEFNERAAAGLSDKETKEFLRRIEEKNSFAYGKLKDIFDKEKVLGEIQEKKDRLYQFVDEGLDAETLFDTAKEYLPEEEYNQMVDDIYELNKSDIQKLRRENDEFAGRNEDVHVVDKNTTKDYEDDRFKVGNTYLYTNLTGVKLTPENSEAFRKTLRDMFYDDVELTKYEYNFGDGRYHATYHGNLINTDTMPDDVVSRIYDYYIIGKKTDAEDLLQATIANITYRDKLNYIDNIVTSSNLGYSIALKASTGIERLKHATPGFLRTNFKEIKTINDTGADMVDTTIMHSSPVYGNTWKDVLNEAFVGEPGKRKVKYGIASNGKTHQENIDYLNKALTSVDNPKYEETAAKFGDGVANALEKPYDANFVQNNIDDLLKLDDQYRENFRRSEAFRKGIPYEKEPSGTPHYKWQQYADRHREAKTGDVSQATVKLDSTEKLKSVEELTSKKQAIEKRINYINKTRNKHNKTQEKIAELENKIKETKKQFNSSVDKTALNKYKEQSKVASEQTKKEIKEIRTKISALRKGNAKTTNKQYIKTNEELIKKYEADIENIKSKHKENYTILKEKYDAEKSKVVEAAKKDYIGGAKKTVDEYQAEIDRLKGTLPKKKSLEKYDEELRNYNTELENINSDLKKHNVTNNKKEKEVEYDPFKRTDNKSEGTNRRLREEAGYQEVQKDQEYANKMSSSRDSTAYEASNPEELRRPDVMNFVNKNKYVIMDTKDSYADQLEDEMIELKKSIIGVPEDKVPDNIIGRIISMERQVDIIRNAKTIDELIDTPIIDDAEHMFDLIDPRKTFSLFGNLIEETYPEIKSLKTVNGRIQFLMNKYGFIATTDKSKLNGNYKIKLSTPEDYNDFLVDLRELYIENGTTDSNGKLNYETQKKIGDLRKSLNSKGYKEEKNKASIIGGVSLKDKNNILNYMRSDLQSKLVNKLSKLDNFDMAKEMKNLTDEEKELIEKKILYKSIVGNLNYKYVDDATKQTILAKLNQCKNNLQYMMNNYNKVKDVKDVRELTNFQIDSLVNMSAYMSSGLRNASNDFISIINLSSDESLDKMITTINGIEMSKKELLTQLAAVGNTYMTREQLKNIMPRIRSKEANDFLNNAGFAGEALTKDLKKMTVEEANKVMKKRTGGVIDKWYDDDLSNIFTESILSTGKQIGSTKVTNHILGAFSTDFKGEPLKEGEKLIVKKNELKYYIRKHGALNDVDRIEIEAINDKYKGQLTDEAIAAKEQELNNVYERLNLRSAPIEIDYDSLKEYGLTKEMLNSADPFIELEPIQYKDIKKSFYSGNIAGSASLHGHVMLENDFLRFNDAARAQKEGSKNAFMKAYDKFLGMYKTFNTVINPGFHINNAVGNAFNSFMYCGAASCDPAKLNIAKTIITNPDPRQYIVIGETKYTYKQINDILKQLKITNQGFFEADIAEDLDKMGKIKNTNYTDLPLIKKGLSIGSEIEEVQRTALFIEALRNGETPYNAKQIVDKFLFDYSDLTDEEVKIMKRAIPFYTFMRKNVPFQLTQIMEQPHTYITLEKALDNFERLSGEDYVPEEDRNEWRRDYVQIPFKLGGKNVGINLNLPSSQLDRLAPNQILGQASPVIKAPIELAAGQYAYTGMPINNVGEYIESQFSPARAYNITQEKEGVDKALYPLGYLTGFPMGTIKR